VSPDIRHVARGLFSALRYIDAKDVQIIFVEEVDEARDEIALTVMNRLRSCGIGCGCSDINHSMIPSRLV